MLVIVRKRGEDKFMVCLFWVVSKLYNKLVLWYIEGREGYEGGELSGSFNLFLLVLL